MNTKIGLLSFLAVLAFSASAFACSMHDEADAKKNTSDKKEAAAQTDQSNSDARAQLGLGNKQVTQESNNQRLPFERHGRSAMARERVLKN